MIQIIEWLKKYWSLLSVAAAGILYALWRQKSVEVDELKLDNKSQQLGGQIAELQTEATNAQKQSDSAVDTYDALLSANPSIREQLGLHDPNSK